MDKKFHPIRAFVIIIVLSLLIILPPMCRLLFPKTEKTTTKNNDKITILICRKNYLEEQITKTVEVRYINAKVNQTKITYTQMPIAEYSMTNTTTNTDLLPSMELSYLQSLDGVAIEQTEEKTTIIINQDSIERNSSNSELKENYFNDKLLSQKIYFTNNYYECEESSI